MFHRDVKKQFNENKYNVLTAKGKKALILNLIIQVLCRDLSSQKYPSKSSQLAPLPLSFLDLTLQSATTLSLTLTRMNRNPCFFSMESCIPTKTSLLYYNFIFNLKIGSNRQTQNLFRSQLIELMIETIMQINFHSLII